MGVTLRDWLLNIMSYENMSQKELAGKIGISQGHISYLLRHTTFLSVRARLLNKLNAYCESVEGERLVYICEEGSGLALKVML